VGWMSTRQLKIEEKGLEKDTAIRSTAMGVVPFALDPEVPAKLAELATGAINWLELFIQIPGACSKVTVLFIFPMHSPSILRHTHHVSELESDM
jgi:hypothetical protein